EEERDTREVTLTYEPISTAAAVAAPPPAPGPTAPATPKPPEGLAGLLESGANRSWAVLAVLAGLLGAAHGLLPGHGKTLTAAAVLGDRGGWGRAILLALVTTTTHLASVGLLAAVFWWTASTRFAAWDLAIGRAAGFVIAAVGLWRLGRWLGGIPPETHDHAGGRPRTLGGLVLLGAAGGALPCWDAIALVIFAEAVGRLGLALLLVAAFSLGLGLVLAALGVAATRLRELGPLGRGHNLERLGAASSLVLAGLGLYLLYRPG
ncbi:MAG: ABC transporter permease, partial [Thermoleophilia bacterium]|nr:ABC transporter permease [Thermoleophilia bacterium]